MKRFIEKYDGKEFDLVIIGGGITGAAVAYDAASRGLSVALIEMGDFGSATSSATSKLIHGGFRYLANGEIGLVRESLRERRTLENIAPNFVYPIPIMFTTNRVKLTNYWMVIKIGMIMYDLLSFDRKFTWDRSKRIPSHYSLSAEETLRLEPNVKKEGLTGSQVYYDCMSIFPERLTLAFIRSAVSYGAEVSNYLKAEGFIFDSENRVSGVRSRDTLNGSMHEIKGKVIINCAGPWADIVLNMAQSRTGNHMVRRSEGIHVITKKLVNDHIVGSITPAGRHFFLIPWRGHSLIGTTDKEYIGTPEDWRVTKKAIQELLDEVNESFGSNGKIMYEDVKYCYGGLRPLVEDQTENVYETSRKYEIYDNSKDGLEGLITVEGGKYTTSRQLAQNVMKMVIKKIRKKPGKMITRNRHLHGCEIKDMTSFMQEIKKNNTDFPEKTLDYLGRIYGTEYKQILDLARQNPALAEPLNDDGEMLAQVVYAARNEMALTLDDIMFRRTGLGTLGHPGRDILSLIADCAAEELNWDSERKKKEIAAVEKALAVPED